MSSLPIEPQEAERVARKKHLLRQREGHHTPDWEGLSEVMRAELIYREMIRCDTDQEI